MPARVGVVEPHPPIVSACQRTVARSPRASASSRGSAASTAASSGPRLRSGEREPQRPQVSADRLQLAYELARGRMIELLRRRRAELGEALEGRRRLARQLDGRGIREQARVVPRLRQRPRAAKHRGDLERRIHRRGQLLVRHRRDRVDRQPTEPRRVELDVVLGHPQLVQVRPHGARRKALVSKLGDRGVPVPLRELLAVRPEHEPVVDHLGQLTAHRARDPLLELEVRAVIRPADDVRDPEVEVVDDGRELVRRGPVGPQEGRAVPCEADGAVVALGAARGQRPLSGLGVERSSLALAHRALVPLDPEPGQVVEDRLLAACDRPGRVGVVDTKDERASALVGEAPVRDRRQRISDVERARGARREADSYVDARRSGHPSIGTCPGCDATRSSQLRIAGYGSRSKSPSCATCV